MSVRRSLFVMLAVIAGLAGSGMGAQPALAHTGHTISIADLTITEGTASGGANPDTDTQNASVTVTLSPAPGLNETISVPWATTAATTPPAATPGSAPLTYPGDYLQSSGTVSFSTPVATSATISIPILRDRSDEENERFIVNLGTPSTTCADPCSASSASVSDGSALVTITDDDAIPSIAMLDASIAENADAPAGTTAFAVTARRTGASERNVRVDFATANNTAVAPGDYTAKTGTFSFANNNAATTNLATTIIVNNDAVAEGNESFFVNISNPANATISDSQGVQTIVDDEAPVVSVSNALVEEGGNLSFQISITTPPDSIGPPPESATVDYTTVNGSAQAPGDFTAQSGSVTFQPFQSTSFTVEVPTHDDDVDEGSETMILRISKPVGCCTGGFDYQIQSSDGTGVIRDNAPSHDFNGDGFSDAAFGVPGEDIGQKSNAGAINVIYGTVNGLSATGTPDQVWHLGVGGVLGATAANDRFGSALAFGDFDGDGFHDIAVGIPGKSGKAGAVSVLYGTSAGLAVADNQLWTQDGGTAPNEVEDTAEAGDGFGTALAAGDFNDDGFTDLAVGSPGESVGSVAAAGAVNVLFGSVTGITSTGDQLWSQDSTDIEDTAEIGDRFGFSVESGDLNGDGFSDLLVGAPWEDVAAIADAGAANVIYGSGSGLAAAGDQFWHQDVTDVEDTSEASDLFGYSAVAGDFNGDGFDDAAFGATREDINAIVDAGGVNVIHGSGSGLAVAGDQFWSQDSTDVEGTAEKEDLFGYAVTAGDFNGDNRDDLAIGAPFEAIGAKAKAGAANVLYGAASGLAVAGDQVWFQDSTNIAGESEKSDQFGAAVYVGDYDGDALADLIVGVRGEGLRRLRSVGAANAIYGAAAGLAATGNQIWHQNIANVAGSAETGDGFGRKVL